jgi:uncharacterized membrane protein YhhN
MKRSAIAFWSLIFILLTLLDATAAGMGVNTMHQVVKPMLMPALLLLLLCVKTPIAEKKLIIAALLFSWLGDVLLLFESKHALFFIAGLASFLITHICYIIYFLRVKASHPSLIRKQPWIAALVAGYGVSLVMFLLPRLGGMKIPVTLYAVVICNMVIFSFHVFNRLSKPSNLLFVMGALLFTASDSMLAVNKFYQPFAGAGVLIMLSYCAAQYCIVMGVVKRKELYRT